MHLGSELLDDDLDQAEHHYLNAIELDDSLRGAWFDLGLIAKWRRRWADCILFNRRAASLRMPDDAEPDPAYWNAGIAATALSDWDTARWAWRAYGIPISGDDGPIDENFGQGVVRLPDGETVWGRRIDPARMQVLSVPLPDGGFRSDDIVLHDGEPVGSRVANGVEYSVFNVIERWKASSVPTISVEVEADDNAVADLLRLADSGGLRVENWTESIAIHCQACSLGRVDFDHPDHDHRPARKPNTPTRLGFSGELTRVRELLQGWTSDTEGTILDLAIYD